MDKPEMRQAAMHRAPGLQPGPAQGLTQGPELPLPPTLQLMTAVELMQLPSQLLAAQGAAIGTTLAMAELMAGLVMDPMQRLVTELLASPCQRLLVPLAQGVLG